MGSDKGTLAIGDTASRLLSQRFAGFFANEAALAALEPASRSHGTVALVLDTGALVWFDSAGTEGVAPDSGDGSWKDVRTATMLYGRSISFLAAELTDVDGYVDGLTTSTSAAALTVADFNGVLAPGAGPGLPPKTGIAFWPSVTTAAAVGAYALADIVFTGTYNGATVARTATLTDADGGETIIADGPLETLTAIDIDAMADTDGEFDFGFSGVSPVLDALGTEKTWQIVAHTDAAAADTGAVVVGYANGETDTVEMAKGEQLLAKPTRVFATTTVPITIYE
jgi:hypothetical protein